MRLVGATPRQISVVSAVEAVVAAVAGVAVGFALFFVFRPLLYHVPFTGAPFAARRPLAALDRHRARRDRRPGRRGRVRAPRASQGPDIAARRATGERRPAHRGSYGSSRCSPASPCSRTSTRPASRAAIGGQLLELLVGFVLLVVGLVLAGPWFTTAGSRLMAKRASRPATLIAGRRLLDNPKAAFRFISGLVIALFVASALIGALSSIAAASSSGGGSAGRDTLAEPFCSFSTSNCPASAQVAFRPRPGACRARADAGRARRDGGPPEPIARLIREVRSELVRGRRVRPAGEDARDRHVRSGSDGGEYRLLPFERPWAPLARVIDGLAVRGPVGGEGRASSRRCGRRRHRRVARARIERARTTLERAFPFQGTPVAVEALDPSTARLLTMIQDMTDVIIVASLIIAACSLAVNIVAGLGERKRPFSLLRLTGVPTALLHRVVALESALPLLLVAAVSIVVGLVSAALYLHSQVGIAFRIPGIAYWATVSRWTRGFARDHRLDVPAPQPDHGTRGRPKRLTTLSRIWTLDPSDQGLEPEGLVVGMDLRYHPMTTSEFARPRAWIRPTSRGPS